MALMTCPDCGSEVADSAPACPNCGRPIAAVAPDPDPEGIEPRRGSRARRGIALAILVALALVGLALLLA